MRAEGLSYLGVSVEGGVVQGGPTAAVRHVYAAQHRDDELGTTQSLIGGGHVKRRLPVLVACVHVGRVTDQYEHRLLDKKKKGNGCEEGTVQSVQQTRSRRALIHEGNPQGRLDRRITGEAFLGTFEFSYLVLWDVYYSSCGRL